MVRPTAGAEERSALKPAVYCRSRVILIGARMLAPRGAGVFNLG
ncbi:hypothetical protein [Deinococcus radiopugnans]